MAVLEADRRIGRWPIGYAASCPDPPGSSCPPTTRPRTSSASSRPRCPCSSAAAPRRLPHPRRRRRLARRHRRDRRPARGAEHDERRGAAPPRARGARPGVPRRLRPRAAARRGLRAARWTPTSRTTRPTSRGCSPRRATAPTSRSARATSPAAASPTGALSGALVSRGGSLVRAARARARGARPHRRLQVLPRARCSRRSTCRRVRSQGYAFQVELTYRAVQRGFRVVEVPIVFRDRAHGQLEDVVADRRSRRSGSCRSCAAPRARRPPAQAAPAPHADRTSGWTPADLVLVQGMARHARRRSRAGTDALAGPRALARSAPRRSRSPAARGLGRRRTIATPDPTPILLPGLNDAAGPRRRSATSCSATRSCSRCTRSPASPASSPAARCRCEAERYSGCVARDPRQRRARSRSPSSSARRCSRCDAGLRARQRAVDARRAARHRRRRCCCRPAAARAARARRALPAARRVDIASRRGDWHELLAATFVTVAIAVPVLVVAALVEVYVSPHLLALRRRSGHAPRSRRTASLHFV